MGQMDQMDQTGQKKHPKFCLLCKFIGIDGGNPRRGGFRGADCVAAESPVTGRLRPGETYYVDYFALFFSNFAGNPLAGTL